MSPSGKTPRDGAAHAFVQNLTRLAAREDRGALAALRRSLQDDAGISAAASPYVVPFLPPGENNRREQAFYLVGALFALDPRQSEGTSLGDAFRRIGGDDNPSVKARFVALLDAHPDDVREHVRHAAALARAKDVALDWEQLLGDLLRWGDADRRVQRRLARDFWGAERPTTTNPESETSR